MWTRAEGVKYEIVADIIYGGLLSRERLLELVVMPFLTCHMHVGWVGLVLELSLEWSKSACHSR